MYSGYSFCVKEGCATSTVQTKGKQCWEEKGFSNAGGSAGHSPAGWGSPCQLLEERSLAGRAWQCPAEAGLEWHRHTLPRQEITWVSTQEVNDRPTYWAASPATRLYVPPSFFLSFSPIPLTQL